MPIHSIAVGGGKGGVGKSLIAANLAIAIAQTGRRVILVDTDLGGANLHTMFGIDRPPVLLEHFIAKKVARLDETLLPTAQKGLQLICGGMPLVGVANPKYAQKLKLIRHIKKLDADVVIMDIGAGIGFNVLDMFNTAQLKIVVFSPQLTSLHNGYGFLKAAVHRRLTRLLDTNVRHLLESDEPEKGGESLTSIIERIERIDPAEAKKAMAILSDQNFYLLGNMAHSQKESQVFNAVGQMIRKHLQINATVLTPLRFGDKIQRSVNERRPFMLWAGIESNAEAFRAIAMKLLKDMKKEVRESQLPPVPKRSPIYDRKESRFPIQIGATLLTDDQALPGTLCDISHFGTLMEFDEAPAGTLEGLLRIDPTTNGDTIEVTVNERQRLSDGQVGFVFGAMDTHTRKKIERLVSKAFTATAVSQLPSSPSQTKGG